MKKIISLMVLLSYFSMTAMQPEELPWIKNDREACEGFDPQLVLRASVDSTAKPGTNPTHLRASYCILKELTGGQKPSIHNLVHLTIVRHVSQDAFDENANNPLVPMSYKQNIRLDNNISPQSGIIPLIYNKNWETASHETYGQMYARIEQEVNNDPTIQNKSMTTYFRCKQEFRNNSSTAPLGHYCNDLNVNGVAKPRSDFEKNNPEVPLTKNLEQLCQRISYKPILFNKIIPTINGVNPTDENEFLFQPTLKQLSKKLKKQLAEQLPLGVAHLKAFKNFLKKTDQTSNVVTLQKKLVPLMLKQWKNTMQKTTESLQSNGCEII